MRLSKEKGPRPASHTRSTELLRAEPLEKIDFQPDRDLSPAQIQGVFHALDNRHNMGDWLDYAGYFILLKVLWPDMQGRQLERGVAKDDIQHKLDLTLAANRADLVFTHLSNLQVLGIPAESYLTPELVTTYLAQFDQAAKAQLLDFNLPACALSLVILGVRPLREVFPDRPEVWRKSQRLLASYHKAGLGMYAQLVVELQALFPEHADEIVMPDTDKEELKRSLQRVPASASAKVAEQAYYLFLLNGGKVSLGPNGEYMSQSAPLHSSPQLHERDLT